MSLWTQEELAKNLRQRQDIWQKRSQLKARLPPFQASHPRRSLSELSIRNSNAASERRALVLILPRIFFAA
jgi:hypothetical protein